MTYEVDVFHPSWHLSLDLWTVVSYRVHEECRLRLQVSQPSDGLEHGHVRFCSAENPKHDANSLVYQKSVRE